jgi:hypothetical protein
MAVVETPAKKMPSARWYLLSAIPVVVGTGIAVLGLSLLLNAIERMPRVVVPGKGDVTLEAGDHIAYGESRSLLDGTAFKTDSLELHCTLTASPGGEAVELVEPTARTKYSTGAFEGQSMFKLTIPRSGTYQLACEGEGGRATMAFGGGIGGHLAITLVGMLGGAAGAFVIAYLVRRKRHRARTQVAP